MRIPPPPPVLAVEEAFTSLRNFLWLALKFTKEMSTNFFVRR